MVSVNTGARPTKAITVFGHVCGDYTVPVRKLSQREAAASKESVLGINGFRRESLWTPADLKREHGLTFQDVIEQQGWDLAKLPFSKGGPAASAALAAFQLANPNTTVVSFKGAIGDDPVGQRVMDYFRTYNMDPSCLMKIQGVPTSYSLVIPEHVEGEGDKRSFLHDPGANAALTFDGIPENDIKIGRASCRERV